MTSGSTLFYYDIVRPYSIELDYRQQSDGGSVCVGGGGGGGGGSPYRLASPTAHGTTFDSYRENLIDFTRTDTHNTAVSLS